MVAELGCKMTEPRRDARVEETLTFRLLVAVNRIVQPFQDAYGKTFDLTLPEWRCMMALASKPGSSGEDIARHMAMDKMMVSRSLRRLEKNGRLIRTQDPANARRNAWEMSEAGWDIFDTILPSALDRDRKAFEHLPEDTKANLIQILRDFEVD